ncbi:MAG: peptidoglycan DD-metalloendopeptidase family protein [Deltaproteobacteria bacterium]|jgi:septal ring factor EnvC (AmiA/AmiB activator)|nr:peptidoglycan DD-metalloendopeptidase family protein [Deltaproteobacteria bacterium]
MSPIRASERPARRPLAWLAIVMGMLIVSGSASARDRQDELEGLREQIRDSRERVSAHEADERALLERLEEVDKRLQSVSADRRRARGELAGARERLASLEPRLDQTRQRLEETRRALAARAVALYRSGELGVVRVLFSASSLPEMLSRASTLRLLVHHDANLVGRVSAERESLERLREEESRAVADREQASRRLERLAGELRAEQTGKRQILTRVRQDRTSERRLLLELEQAAQALEETIRTLGAKSARRGDAISGSGFGGRRGSLVPPVDAEVSQAFGRVVDPEFRTATFHSGIDFAAEAGTAVRCVAEGIVRFAGWFRGYGRIVIVDHGDGFHTVSGHLDEIRVGVDEAVDEGQMLGTVGETGSLRGPGLYFELRRDGEPVDPETWLLDRRG